MAFDCQAAERRPLVADVSLVSYQPLLPGPRKYCNLLEKEAQCLAAIYAPQARLLEREAEALDVQSGGLHHRRSTSITQLMLRLQAVHERNRMAATALQLLLRIAGAESAADKLRQQLDEIARTVADLGRMQTAGVETPVSLSESESQNFDVRHKLGEIELTIDLLSEQLSNVVGAEPPPGSRFWPDVDLRVDPSVPAVEEAQMTALAQRADLAALRAAAMCGARSSLDEMRAVLSQTSGLGLAASGCQLVGLRHPHAKGDEAAIREEQLQAAVADKERAIRNEVRQAVATIEARVNQIALARGRLDVLREHRVSLLRKVEVSPDSRFEASQASISVLLAEQDLFHDVIEWRIAVVKLLEAQGELAIEYGYMLVFEYTNGCP
jgi:hypothetical protein